MRFFFLITILLIVFSFFQIFDLISWNVQRAVYLDDVCLCMRLLFLCRFYSNIDIGGRLVHIVHHTLQARSVKPCFLALLNGCKRTTAIPRVSGMTFSLLFVEFRFVDPSTCWLLCFFFFWLFCSFWPL